MMIYIDPKTPLYLLQKIFRGYSDKDLWAMNDFVVKKIRKPLKAFIKLAIAEGYGYPSRLTLEEYPDGKVARGKNKSTDRQLRAKWTTILKKIDKAFDLYYETEIKATPDFRRPNKKEWEQIREGFELFGKYLSALWD